MASGELLGDFEPLSRTDLPTGVDLAPAAAELARALRGRSQALIDALRRETGFLPQDCEEIVEASLAYAETYAAHGSTQIAARTEAIQSDRHMRLIDVPVGTVAAILPHNAFLPLALSCLLNGLRAGNRVVLRGPQQSALSAGLLSSALQESPRLSPWVSIAVCSARPFVDWFFSAPIPGLLHYFGSSRHAADLAARGFQSGKTVLIDGEGNAWVYVDEGVPLDDAARILVQGAFRYNGGTCTSINGAVIHPRRFEEVRAEVAKLASSWEAGPLFDEAQAEWCLKQIVESGGEIVAGGVRTGAHLAPTVVVDPDPASSLVREGLFGPALWITNGDAEAFATRWRGNRYPLCAAILSAGADPIAWAARLPNVARLVVNGDPSIEDPFEFWGGYPPSGQNEVSAWTTKYLRTVQIDVP